MANGILENRIVEMVFDAQEFRQEVERTKNSVEDFKDALNFDDAAKGFDTVEKAAKGVDMTPILAGVQSVENGFSGMQVVATTVFSRITDAVLQLTGTIASSMTNSARMGFSEYSTQIGSIQTILANTSHLGTNLDDVTAALDDLNVYADQTIYNFTEMTRNIGTFTAAGVDLDTSRAAIKGIANLAAISGSTSEQASRAMYQLSQALAAGRVNLQDWNSVVNAGMGGKVFQDALVNTAKHMGIAVDLSNGFRESISSIGGKETWLTSDVLLSTLKQFTGEVTSAELAAQGYTESEIEAIQTMAQTAVDAATKVKTVQQLFDTIGETIQSGWTQSWEYIIGDFNEAQNVLTAVKDAIEGVINPMSTARNNALKFWASSPLGRPALLKSVANLWTTITKILDKVKTAFKVVFPKGLGQILVDLTRKFQLFTIHTRPTRDTLTSVYKISYKFFSFIKSRITDVSNFVKVFKALALSYDENKVAALGLSDGFQKMYDILKKAINKIRYLIATFQLYMDIFNAKLAKQPGIKKLKEQLALVGQDISNFVNKIKENLGIKFVKKTRASSPIEFIDSLVERINIISGRLATFIEVFRNIWDKLKEVVTTIISGIDFESIFKGIKVSGLFAIASTFIRFAGLLAGLGTMLYNIETVPKKFGHILTELRKTLIGFRQVTDVVRETIRINARINSLVKVAVAIGIMAGAVVALAGIEERSLYRALVVVGLLALILAAIAKIKFPTRELKTNTAKKDTKGIGEWLKGFATELIKPFNEIGKGLKAIGYGAAIVGVIIAVIGSLISIVVIINTIKQIVVTSSGKDVAMAMLSIVGIISSLILLYVAIVSYAEDIDMNKIKNVTAVMGIFNQIIGVIAAMSGLVYMLSTIKNEEGQLTNAVFAVVTMTTFIILIAKTLEDMEDFDIEEKIESLTSIVKVIGKMISPLLISIAVLTLLNKYNATGLEKSVDFLATLIIVVSGAVVLLMAISRNFNEDEWSTATSNISSLAEILKSLASLVIVFTIALGALSILSRYTNDDVLVNATALLLGLVGFIGAIYVIDKISQNANIVGIQNIIKCVSQLAFSLIVLAAAFAVLSYTNASWDSIGQTLITVIGIIGVIAGIALLLSKNVRAVSTFKVIADVIGYLGLSFLAFSVGVKVLGGALPILSAALPGAGQALSDFLARVEDHMGVIIVATIITVALAALIAYLVYKFAPDLSGVFSVITNIINSFSDSLSDLPMDFKLLILGGLAGLIAALDSMDQATIDQLGRSIIKVLGYLGNIAGYVIDALVALLIIIIFEICEAIQDNSDLIAAALADAIYSISVALRQLLINYLLGPIIVWGQVLVRTLIDMYMKYNKIGFNLIKTGLKAIIDFLRFKAQEAIYSVDTAFKSIKVIFTNYINQFKTQFSYFGQFISEAWDGITNFDGKAVIDAAKTFTENMQNMEKTVGSTDFSTVYNDLYSSHYNEMFAEDLKTLKSEIQEYADAAEEYRNTGKHFSEDWSAFWNENITLSQSWMDEWIDTMDVGDADIQSHFDGYKDLVEQKTSLFQESMAKISNASADTVEEIDQRYTDAINKTHEEIQANMNEHAPGLALPPSYIEAAKKNVKFYGDTGTESGNEYVDKTEEAASSDESVGKIYDAFAALGSSGEDGLMASLDQMGADVTADDGPLADLIKSCDQFDTDFTDKGNDLGTFMGSGMDDGLSSYEGILGDTVERLCNESYNRGKNALDAHSPSKVFAKLGNYMSQGVAVGITEEGQSPINSMVEVLSNIADSFDETEDFTPTITPVLDTSNLQNGIKQIPGMFGNSSYRISGINARLINDTKAYRDKMQESAIYNDSNVVGSINNLRADMGKFTTAVENMQIVMDNGVLVGAITPGVDKALGSRSIRKGRSN